MGELPAKLCRGKPKPEKRGHTYPPNGQTATFWQIVRDNPNDLPVQIANKLQAVTGRNLTGAQVKQLIAAGPPPAIDPDDEFI